MKITKNQLAALVAIRDSEYQDDATGTSNVVGRHVWINCLWAFEGKGKSLGGVLSSLQAKGLITVNNSPGEETAALTEAGLAAVPFASPNTESTPATETTVEPKETVGAAVVYGRPRTDKLRALHLAMCPKGRLFGEKAPCRCCGAIVPPDQPVQLKAPRRKTHAAPVEHFDSALVLSESQRSKNAEASAKRAARRAGLGQK